MTERFVGTHHHPNCIPLRQSHTPVQPEDANPFENCAGTYDKAQTVCDVPLMPYTMRVRLGYDAGNGPWAEEWKASHPWKLREYDCA